MDIDIIRKDTQGCSDKLFFNSAGASLQPNVVVQKTMAYLLQEQQLGGYEVERLRASEFANFYTEMATLLHCNPRNIAYMYSATDAYSKALSAIPFQSGDTILTTTNDYISNQFAFFSLQKRFNIQIIRAKNLVNGTVDLEDFEHLVRQYRPILIAITHIPTNSGLVQPAEEIGKIAQKYDSWYLLDACQSVGQMVVNPQKIGCDFLNATGRKFLRGPRASGFLYVSDKVLDQKLEPLFIDRRGGAWTTFDQYQIHDSAKRFESQEISVAMLGLTQAVQYANEIGMEAIEERNNELCIRLREKLLHIKNLQLLDKGDQLSNLITFHVPSRTLDDITTLLNTHKVVYSASLKNFALIDFTEKGVEWAVRFSPHYFNTFDEIDQLATIMAMN